MVMLKNYSLFSILSIPVELLSASYKFHIV